MSNEYLGTAVMGIASGVWAWGLCSFAGICPTDWQFWAFVVPPVFALGSVYGSRNYWRARAVRSSI